MTPDDFFRGIRSGDIPIKPLGKGAYNDVSVTEYPVTIDDVNERWVVKSPILDESESIQKQSSSDSLAYSRSESPLNSPVRAQKKWQTINHGIPVHLFSDESNIPIGWIVPYLGETTPSDEQISLSVIDIYQRTGNIIADACIPSNFVYDGERAICIDMDLAIHRDSFSSTEYYNDTIASEEFDVFFDKARCYGTPLTQSTIKTLLYLEEELAGYDVDNHLIDPWIVEKLSLFRVQKLSIHPNTLKLLKVLQDNHIEEQYLLPKYLNQLVLSWSEDMPVEVVQQRLIEIKSVQTRSVFGHFHPLCVFTSMPPLTAKFIATQKPAGFFEGLNKRMTFVVPDLDI